MPYLFADCVLDPDRRELRRGEDVRMLEPQVFDLLLFLVENRDRVVTKDDLLASVWEGRIVSESTLATRIGMVRTAIGDSGDEQRLVRTLQRRGYRFVGDVSEAPATRADEPPAPQVADTTPAAPASDTAAPLSPTNIAPARRLWIVAGAVAGCAALAILLLVFRPLDLPWRTNQAQKFDAARIPLVNDAGRRTLASYSTLPDAKALAISISNYGVASGAADLESAKQEALERCRQINPRFGFSCRLYAAGPDVVWNKASPPLPAADDLHTETLDVVFDPENVPTLTDPQKAALKSYRDMKQHKIMAIASRSYYFDTSPSRDEAIRLVIERCGFYVQRPCLIVAVDGLQTVQFPKDHLVQDIFLPRTATEALTAEDRERIALVFQGKDWRALARGQNGWYPVADAASETAAVDAALKACAQVDTGCRIFAISNFLIADKP